MSKEFKTYSMDIAGKTLRVDIGRVAAQANGAAFMHYGDTTVLSTITASEKPRDGIDFFPLSVEYEEKMYAVGKLVKNIINDNPILLLDDVMSELDSSRREALLEEIKDIQTIITCTGYDDFIKEQVVINNVYHVTNGTVTKI